MSFPPLFFPFDTNLHCTLTYVCALVVPFSVGMLEESGRRRRFEVVSKMVDTKRLNSKLKDCVGK